MILTWTPFCEFWALLKGITISHTAKVLIEYTPSISKFAWTIISIKSKIMIHELWFRFKGESNLLEEFTSFTTPLSNTR